MAHVCAVAMAYAAPPAKIMPMAATMPQMTMSRTHGMRMRSRYTKPTNDATPTPKPKM